MLENRGLGVFLNPVLPSPIPIQERGLAIAVSEYPRNVGLDRLLTLERAGSIQSSAELH